MARLTFTVTEDDTAVAVGSGDVPALGSPRLLAWIEAATVADAADLLADGETSVGTRMELEHLVASPVGTQVEVSAELAHRDGRLLRFAVGATDAAGRLVGTATITRVVVDRARFLGRLTEPG